PGTGGFVGLIGGVDRLGISDWRTGSGGDLSSRNLDPQYIAPTATTPDLHISAAVATPVEASGTATTPAVSDDFDGQTRSGLTPVDMGADAGNFTALSNCSGAPPAGTISGVASLCAGNSGTTLSFANASSNLGITFLWKYSTTSGGPYTNGGTQSTYATGALTQTTYFIVTSTCSFGGGTTNSPEFTLAVNPIPTVTAGSNSPVCDGQALNLTATSAIGTTFAWTGPNSFTSTSQNPTIAALTSTGVGTYSVTASAGGCTSTVSTTAVTLLASPTITSVTATPSTICSGSNSQLQVNAATGYVVTPVTYALLSGTATTISSWAGGADATTDDGFSSAITLPFSFVFDGVSYNQVWVGTNGYITFQNPSAVTGSNSRTAANMNTSTTPNAVIALNFADLNAVSPGVVGTFTVGSPGSRVFVVDFNIGFYASATTATGTVRGQIQLFEGSNAAEVHVTTIAHGTSSSQNALGIENAAGNYRLFAPGRNTAAVWNVNTSEAWRFAQETLTYSWSPSTFLSSTTIANPVATAVTATTPYTVTVTGTNGCPRTGTTTVTVGAGTPPTANIAAGGATTFCTGGSVALTSTVGGGCQPYTYAWSNGVTTVATTANYTATASGNYTLTVTDNSSQVVTSNAIVVTVNPIPTVTAGSNSPVCIGQPLNLTATSAIGTTFAWTGPNSFSSTTQNPVIASLVAANAGTYSVTASAAGCTSTVSTTAVVSNPSPTISSVTATPSTVCSGSNSQLNVVASVSGYTMGSGGASFTDISTTGTTIGTLTDDNAFNVTIPAFSFNGVSYTSVRTGTNGTILFGTTTGSVIAGNAALPSTSNGSNIFLAPWWDDLDVAGPSAVYTQQIGNLFIFQWNALSHNTPDPPLAADVVTFQVQLNLTTGAIYFVYQDVFFGGTHVAQDAGVSATVGIQWASTAGSALQSSFNTASLTNGQVISFTPTTPSSYSWSPATFLSSTTITNPVATAVTATTPYTVTVTGSNGCPRTGTTTVTVGVGAPPSVSIAAGGATTFCTGGSVALTSTVTDGCQPYTYAWSNGTSTVATTANYTATASGNYTLTVTDNASQVGTSNAIAVTVNPIPAVTAGSNSPVCVGQTVNLTATSAIGTSFAWTGPNSFTSATQNPSIANATALAGGTYSVTASAAGCTSPASTVSVTMNAAPVITGTTATPATVCTGANSQLNVAASAALPFVRITEITLYGTGTGQTPTYPTGVTSDDLVELNNTSTAAADISGWTLIDYPSASSTANRTMTFPAGSIIPANGVAVVNWGPGTNNLTTRMFYAGGSSDSWTSGTNQCVVLKNGGTIVDAVAVNSATFAPGTGVTSADWTGTGASSPGGIAGTVRTGANDTNTNADWVASSATTQSIGTFNPGYNNPNTGTITGYAWTPTTFLSNPSIQNPVATAVTATTTYTVSVTGSNSCSSTSNVTVTVGTGAPPSVSIAAAGATTFCAGGSMVLNSTVTDGCQPYTYAWSNGTTTVATTPSYTATTSGSYTLTVTDNGSQSGTSNAIVVTANPIPAVTAGSNSPVCDGQALNLTATSAIGTGFSWTGPNSFTSTSQNPTIPALTSAGVGTYSVTATAAGCTSPVSTTAVTLLSAPTIGSVTATPSTICSGSNSQLQVTAASGYVVTPVTYGLLSGSATTISTWPVGASGSTDDGFSNAITLPFSFTFNGTAYSQVWVATNGYITFTNPTSVAATDSRSAASMNSATAPNNVIALSYADLNAVSP
ncbi:MAG TPA: lamin tail domain-containing protein, partial [Flavobacteriales bacterium]|nr:lamin tail domain-containing protein [Flavobacteriales bacterium]